MCLIKMSHQLTFHFRNTKLNMGRNVFVGKVEIKRGVLFILNNVFIFMIVNSICKPVVCVLSALSDC